jgi:hypothetical protein
MRSLSDFSTGIWGTETSHEYFYAVGSQGYLGRDTCGVSRRRVGARLVDRNMGNEPHWAADR